MYTKDRTIELRQRCSGFLKQNNLSMKVEVRDGEHVISFANDDFKSPISLVFSQPEGDEATASWQNCTIHMECFDLQTLGETWKCWHFLGYNWDDLEEVETNEEALERVHNWLERSDLLPQKNMMPGIIDSTELALTFIRLDEDVPDVENLTVRRDTEGEHLEFDVRGEKFRIVFPHADAENDTAVLTIGNGRARKLELDDEVIVAAVERAACKFSRSMSR